MFLETFQNQENINSSSVLMSTRGKYLIFAKVIRKCRLCLALVKTVQQHILNELFQFDLVLKGINFLLQMATDLIMCPNKQN